MLCGVTGGAGRGVVICLVCVLWRDPGDWLSSCQFWVVLAVGCDTVGFYENWRLTLPIIVEDVMTVNPRDSSRSTPLGPTSAVHSPASP